MKLWMANLDNMRSLDPDIPMDEFVQSLNAYNLQFLHFVVGGLLDRPCWNVLTPVAILLEKVGQKHGPLLPPLAKALVAVHKHESSGSEDALQDLKGLRLSQMPTLYMSKLYKSYLESRENRRVQKLTTTVMPTAAKLQLIEDMLESIVNEEHVALLKFGKTYLSLEGPPLMKWLLEDSQPFNRHTQ